MSTEGAAVTDPRSTDDPRIEAILRLGLPDGIPAALLDEKRGLAASLLAAADAVDPARIELAATRTQLADLRWAEMLTNQACAAGLHADWWVDSEHNHTCPWCALAACRAREAAIRRAAETAMKNPGGHRYVFASGILAVLGDETGTDKAEPLADSRVEAAAIALYEHSRGHVYVGAEWDWPNIDNSYDRDDEDEYPEGVTPDPEWLRNRFRASARAALTAAGSVGAQDQGSDWLQQQADKAAQRLAAIPDDLKGPAARTLDQGSTE